MIAAAIVLIGPPLLLGSQWLVWICNALVLLEIDCPCARVISTPVSIVATIAAAAGREFSSKNGLYAKVPGRIKAIALDKAGTLTTGKPRSPKRFP